MTDPTSIGPRERVTCLRCGAGAVVAGRELRVGGASPATEWKVDHYMKAHECRGAWHFSVEPDK